MSWLSPLDDEAMDGDQQRAFERALKKLRIEDSSQAPQWLRILANSPEFLKDVYMNVDRGIFNDDGLQEKTKILLAAVAAAHWGRPDVAEFFAERARNAGFDDHQIHEALGVAATSTSFNHYYKFRSLADTDAFDGYKPNLRASLFVKSSMGKAFTELVNLMISSANGCKSCVSGHIDKASDVDVTKTQMDEAIRVGAIVASICQFVESSSHYETA